MYEIQGDICGHLWGKMYDLLQGDNVIFIRIRLRADH